MANPNNMIHADIARQEFGIDIHFQGDQRLMFFVSSQLEYTLWLETFKLVLEMN